MLLVSLLSPEWQCDFSLPHPQWPLPPFQLAPSFLSLVHPKHFSPLSTSSRSHSCYLSSGSQSSLSGSLIFQWGQLGPLHGRQNPRDSPGDCLKSPFCPACNPTVSATKQPHGAGPGLSSQSQQSTLTFSFSIYPEFVSRKVLPLLHLVEARKSRGAGFLRNPVRFFPIFHPFSSESLLGFLLIHTIWWEFLQLHILCLFEVFPAVFIATEEATQWLKTINMYLFAHVSVGQLGSV